MRMNRTGASTSSAFVNASSILGTCRSANRPDFRNPNQSISTVNRSAISTSSRLKPLSIMCLVKGRGTAAPETGIASMNLHSNSLHMSQFCDDQLYNQLFTKIHMIDPSQIVVAQTLSESSTLSGMFEKLVKTFPQCEIKCVPRRYMNDNKGREIIRRLCTKDSSGIDIALQSKVYVLLAVSGLVTYVEEMMSMYLAPHTVRMVYSTGENTMLIDHGTAVNLELLRSSAECTDTNVKHTSLFSILNHTQTTTGSLMLRANLLQPPTESDLIEQRYDAVEELLENVEMCASLHSALSRFPDIENAISLSIQLPRVEGRSTTEAKLRNVLSLKSALDVVPCLAKQLETAECALLKGIRQKIEDGGLDRILCLILSKLNSKAMVTSGLLNMRGQLVFAVKHGLDGKLDAMRGVYNDLVEDVEDTVRHLSETYQLALKLAFTAQRGFHVTMKVPKVCEMPDIPANFMKISKRAGMFTMTTEKLIHSFALSIHIIHSSSQLLCTARISECLDVIYNLSNRVVTNLLTDVHKEVDCLNSLVHAVGLLDMLVALTQTSRLPDYVRPELGAVLAVKSARHPVAEFSCASKIVPNDMFFSEDANFVVLTGANNSGKSFYLRMVGVIQVMAQIGCFVPAQLAIIRVCDQLFSRIGSESSYNNMESTFTLEMKEMAFVLRRQTPNMLILLDELCRGTSPEEAVDICFTVCEQLIKSPAFTAFATHFKELCQLEMMYDNCACFCMVTRYEEPHSGDVNNLGTIYNNHKLQKGIAKDVHYGLKLASTMNFPREIIDRSFQIAEELENISINHKTHTEDGLMVYDSFSNSEHSSRVEHQIISEIKLIGQLEGSLQDKGAALRCLKEKYECDLERIVKEAETSSESNSPTAVSTSFLGNSSHRETSYRNLTTQISLTYSDEDSSQHLDDSSPPRDKCLFSPTQLVMNLSHNSVNSPINSSDKSLLRHAGKVFLEGSSSSPDLSAALPKLVDYPVSPICPSGSSITNMPHSFLNQNSSIRFHRASTNKYVDARSPISVAGVSNKDCSANSSSKDKETCRSSTSVATSAILEQSSDLNQSIKEEYPPTVKTEPSCKEEKTTPTLSDNGSAIPHQTYSSYAAMVNYCQPPMGEIKEEPMDVVEHQSSMIENNSSKLSGIPPKSKATYSLVDELLTVPKSAGSRQNISHGYSKVKVEPK